MQSNRGREGSPSTARATSAASFQVSVRGDRHKEIKQTNGVWQRRERKSQRHIYTCIYIYIYIRMKLCENKSHSIESAQDINRNGDFASSHFHPHNCAHPRRALAYFPYSYQWCVRASQAQAFLVVGQKKPKDPLASAPVIGRERRHVCGHNEYTKVDVGESGERERGRGGKKESIN